MSTNVVTATFKGLKTVRTRELRQWDYGQVLQFVGLPLPETYTVHFSNREYDGTAKTQIGDADGVVIPDEYLVTGSPVYAFVFLHEADSDGETVFTVTIPVVKRPKPTEDEPTPVQQGLIERALQEINAAVESAENSAEQAQAAAQNIQETVDAALLEAKESGEFDGPQGLQGPQGPQGDKGDKGDPGIAVTVRDNKLVIV